ncbi:MAG: TasA family protein [Actinomycetota bacterium]|nr:TasA family protein [Actinomycetota bacterium]
MQIIPNSFKDWGMGMNRRILMSVLVVTMTLALVGGATFAVFTDTATNPNNTFTAGTVIISLENDGTGLNIPLFNSSVDGEFYPGSPAVTKTLRVHNDGSLPIRLSGFSAVFSGDTTLADGLSIGIVEVDQANPTITYPLYQGAFSNLAGAGVSVAGVQTVSAWVGSVNVGITIWMPTAADDTYQGLNMTADISATAQQL